MKLLLTSSGFKNKLIAQSLRDLAKKPFSRLRLVFVPTAANVEEGNKDWLIKDLANCEKLGFAQVDIVDISAVPKRIWRPRISQANILMFGGGNTFHLNYWIKKSGLDKLLPKLLRTRIYVGVSAGSIVATPSLELSQSKRLYDEKPGRGENIEKGLGFVNFLIRPHLNSPHFPKVRTKYIRELAKGIKYPIYAIDDQTAISVDGKKISIISRGRWEKFN